MNVCPDSLLKVRIQNICSSFFSFCFVMFAFPFWLDTLVTSFGWVSDSTRLFIVSKEGFIILLRSEDSLLTIKGNSMSHNFSVVLFNLASSYPTGRVIWVRLTELQSLTNFLNSFHACEKDTKYFRSLSAALWFIQSAIFLSINCTYQPFFVSNFPKKTLLAYCNILLLKRDYSHYYGLGAWSKSLTLGLICIIS